MYIFSAHIRENGEKIAMWMMIISVLICRAAMAAEIGVTPPDKVRKCIALQSSPRVALDENVNPFFIRGDFDGDGVPDYAVAVKNADSGKPGILVCTSLVKPRLFSAGSNALPDGLTLGLDESLGAVGWTVLTRKEVVNTVRSALSVHMRGEAILLQYEGDRALIFWDGVKYRWIGWF